MKKYKHSTANYPESFLGTVISPHKMCLQFLDVVTKLRVAYHDTSDLIKLPCENMAMPVVGQGVAIYSLNIACPMPLLEKLQQELVTSYGAYLQMHSEYYKRTYGKDFSRFLIETRDNLDELIKTL